MRKKLLLVFLGLVLFCLGSILLYNLPPVHERLAWRVDNAAAEVRRWLNPPEELVFVPQQSGEGAVATMVQATLGVLLPASATPGMLPTATQAAVTPPATATPAPSATPTPQPTPIPAQVLLNGIIHEYQQFNNCGPANLAMALSFWDWQGDQRDTRKFLRPNLDVDDKNVMPAEMVAYVQGFTNLRALARFNGDLELVKRLIAAGFPALIEEGHDPQDDDWWMGHYLVLNGYDDAAQRFTGQDSLLSPDLSLPYAEFATHWRDFNYVYIVIYPPEREAEVFRLLGPQVDETYNYQSVVERAQAESQQLEGRERFFALFNLGAGLVGLKNYPLAAEAYDQAFALYARLPEDAQDVNSRPYRLMWYRVEAYEAYYYTGRYQDVINLANTTLAWVSKPVLEETYYWRGMAYEALGSQNQAISDYKKAATLNPNFAPPREALQRLGVPLP